MEERFPNLEPFEGIDEYTLRSRIREFRRLNYREISDQELTGKLIDVFSHKTPLGTGFSFPVVQKSYPKGTRFYRARKIPAYDGSIPLDTMKKEVDAWEPPPDKVKTFGRVNKIGQPVLYTCANDAGLTLLEAGIRHDDHFCMIVYEACRSVSVSLIGGDVEDFAVSESSKAKLEIFYDFLEAEFTREVGEGLEHLYKLSHAIADSFFNYPEQDAWVYRAVADKNKFNCAFMTGRAKLCLKLKGVLVGVRTESVSDAFSVKFIVDFDESTGDAHYHAVGSARQRELFPEIALRS